MLPLRAGAGDFLTLITEPCDFREEQFSGEARGDVRVPGMIPLRDRSEAVLFSLAAEMTEFDDSRNCVRRS